MEHDKAKDLLGAERVRVEQLLSAIDEAGVADRGAANEPGDMYDSSRASHHRGYGRFCSG